MAPSRPVASLLLCGLLVVSCSGEPGDQPSTNPPATAGITTTVPTQLLVAGEMYGEIRERNLAPGADGAAVNEMIRGTNEFALRLYREVAGDTNLVVGNYSISTVLLLTMAGTAGETREGFSHLLGVAEVDPARLHPAVNAIDLVLEGRAGDGLQLNTANRLFAQVGLPLEEEFLNVAVESYGAPA
ncbi:MAG TPA: serpin family protein, partial [Acidimicrobiia bacterium]|nr:serpin family protein [Acidimicrobiia bacterium]